MCVVCVLLSQPCGSQITTFLSHIMLSLVTFPAAQHFPTLSLTEPVPVAARSKASVCGRSLAEIVGSNPTGTWMSVRCECCVLSGRGLCDVLITRPEGSYRLQCVAVCDLKTSRMRKPWSHWDAATQEKNILPNGTIKERNANCVLNQTNWKH